MFSKQQEEELAEIKALTLELSQRFDLIHAQLERIEEAQQNLATSDPGKAGPERKSRKAGGSKAKAGPGTKKPKRRKEAAGAADPERRAKKAAKAARKAKRQADASNGADAE